MFGRRRRMMMRRADEETQNLKKLSVSTVVIFVSSKSLLEQEPHCLYLRVQLIKAGSPEAPAVSELLINTSWSFNPKRFLKFSCRNVLFKKWHNEEKQKNH